MAYDRLEPFGELRADLRAGIIASTMVNLWSKKGSKSVTPGDFMPEFDKQVETQTSENMLRTVEMLNAALGGRDLRRQDADDR